MFSDKYVFFHLTEITLQYLIMIYKYYDTQIRFRFFFPIFNNSQGHSFLFIHLLYPLVYWNRIRSKSCRFQNYYQRQQQRYIDERLTWRAMFGFPPRCYGSTLGAAERKEQGRRDARRRRCEKRPAKGQDAARGSSRRSLAKWRRMRRMHVCRRHGWPWCRPSFSATPACKDCFRHIHLLCFAGKK